MRKYALLYAILALMILAGALALAAVQTKARQEVPDYVAVNEIVRQAALHWQAPGQMDLSDFRYRFALIDDEGTLLYASDEGLPDSIPAAVRRGFIPVDVVVGSAVAGKALVEVFPDDALRETQAGLARVTAAAFILLAALNLGFLLTLHHALVRPFERLQSFAHHIAAGRLDEPLPMDKNNLFGLFTQSFDVMRESLQEARKSQIRAERAKKELVASINHDVKNPVTSIRLIAELLRAGATDPAVAEKLRTIETKADQIDRLMNDMLRSALEELGELTVTLIAADSGTLRRIFTDADHLSLVRVGEIPACLIELDPTRMEQVIGNIVANAYKYAGTRIDVDCAVSGELLRVDVNDYGPGVREEELDLITTKFYRGENAKAAPREGEGLGLYIAKLLMDKMGGGLEAFNRADGFCVRLWLKLSS